MFQEIKPEQFEKSAFDLIGNVWMLVGAEASGKTNAMTASWGGLGVMWGKNVSFVVIRPQRYTKELVDATGRFSLSFLDSSYKKQKGYFGTASGRDEDKIATAGLQLAHEGEVPYFADADIAILCKKLFVQPYLEENFLDKSLIQQWYPEKDFHTLYISEVEKILVRK